MANISLSVIHQRDCSSFLILLVFQWKSLYGNNTVNMVFSNLIWRVWVFKLIHNARFIGWVQSKAEKDMLQNWNPKALECLKSISINQGHLYKQNLNPKHHLQIIVSKVLTLYSEKPRLPSDIENECENSSDRDFEYLSNGSGFARYFLLSFSVLQECSGVRSYPH